MSFDLIDLEMGLCDFLVDYIEILQYICVTVDDFFTLIGKLSLHVILEIIDSIQDFSGLFQSLI